MKSYVSKKYVIISMAILFTALTSSSVMADAANSSMQRDMIDKSMQQATHYYDLDKMKIAVMYDFGDIIAKSTGESLVGSLQLMSADVKGYPMKCLTDVEATLLKERFTIVIYVFQSRFDTFIINESEYEWSDLAYMLKLAPFSKHIFAGGNTKQLLAATNYASNVYGSDSELVDAQHGFVYALWQLADILEYEPEYQNDELANSFSQDLRRATLQFFSDNFNELAMRQVEPQDPLGTEAPETIQARIDRYYEEHPESAVKLPREIDGKTYICDNETMRYVDEETGEILTDGYGIDIMPKESSLVSDFILNLLPDNSGLRGPIGGIIDILLEVLLGYLGDAIGIDASTVENIANALLSIPDFIGAIKDKDSSKMKEFLEKLKPMLPIPQEYMKYFDILVDALFLLRGDTSDIINFIFSAIELLIPSDWVEIGGINIVNVLKGIFEIVPGVIDKINSGASIVDTIFSVLNENIVQNLTSTFLGKISSMVGGITPTDITNLVSTITSTTSTIISMLTNFNIDNLLTSYAPALFSAFQTLVPSFSINQKVMNITMKAANLLLVATNVVDSTLDESLIALLTDIVPVSVTDRVTTIRTTVTSIVAKITELIETGVSSATDLKTTITGLIDTHGASLGLSTGIKGAISEAAALITYVSKEFDITSPSSLTNISTMIHSLMEGIQDMGLYDFGENLTGIFEIVDKVITAIYGLIGFIKDPDGKIKEVIGSWMDKLGSPEKMIGDIINFILEKIVSSGSISNEVKEIMGTVAEGITIVMQLIKAAQGNGVQGLLVSLLQGASYVITQITGIDIAAYVKLAKSLFGQFLGIDSEAPSLDDVMAILADFIDPSLLNTIKQFVSFLLDIKDIFTNGFKTIFGKLTEWLAGMVTQLISSLTGEIGGLLDFELWSYDLDINVGLGGMNLFTINLFFSISLGFEFDAGKLGEMIFDLVFKGDQIFDGDVSFGKVLKTALSFFSLTPIFEAGFELSDFGGGGGFMDFMLSSLGLEISFSGYGYFKLQLFSFKNGSFSMEDFFKVIEWGFGFKITLSRMFTLLDFITGGAGGSLNSIGKYIGLDAISITIFFELALDIVKRAATATQPESGSLSLAISIGFTVSLGIDIFIAELRFTGTLVITLTFVQDLVTPTPLQIYLAIELIITVTIGFLFWDWDFDFRWSPSGFAPPGYNLTASNDDDAEENGAMGLDADQDGLSNEYEEGLPGLDPYSVDSDGDGLDDKFETQTYKTDPTLADTDGDGLTDFEEFELKTDPRNRDSDFEGLTDYEEVKIYGTNPLGMDTDFDGLTDDYEVKHVWNISGITPSVLAVSIGGEVYNDRTDPLNPDTDGDGLIDGEEGPRGIHYGPDLYNSTDGEMADGETYVPTDPLLLFNEGYTHPLDNDTDDDSYEQTYDGAISPRQRFLRDMTDYVEVFGQEIIYIDPETGEPQAPVMVRTNPCNPDTDGDTGVTAEQRINPPFGFFLNSDGYELALTPPTDPLDGDSDDDGLIDGLEGILRPDANHTDALNPDTDGDGLGDMQELKLGTDPRSVDTDLDNVCDGDEFFIFGTNPFLADTDSDGIQDGDELWLYHSSPFLRDSDADGISDYDEVYVYFSNPVDEDSDNDGLDDYEEIYIFYTDPFDEDTDDDGLYDGEETKGLPFPDIEADWELFWADKLAYIEAHPDNITWFKSDPTKWDTDRDSLLTIDQFGEISMSMSDGEEYNLYHTNPTYVDSDFDGIADGWELWLGKGVIPNFTPLALDTHSNDTDGDGLLDGTEIHIANTSTLLYPYIGFHFTSPHNTSAVLADTDGDGLDDYYEIRNFLAPDNPDTDNDTLSDYLETYLYFTKPYKNDTDGDGLADWEEIGVNRTYMTSPYESDSDGDLLPDGAEVHLYGRDPLNPDENSNGLLDGMEIDSDSDGLKDGEEYYTYGTVEVLGGGIYQPDSDRDGLFDGFEVYTSFTDPTLWDTDGDTYSDGLEWFVGTDPLTNTSSEDMTAALNLIGLDAMMILSPVSKEYQTTTIPIVVYDNSESVSSMEYRYREVNGTWSLAESLSEDGSTNYWYGTLELEYVNATYEFEVVGEKSGDNLISTVTFDIYLNPLSFEVVSPLAMTYIGIKSLPIQVSAGLNYTDVWFTIRYPNGTFIDNTTLEYDVGLGDYYLADYDFSVGYKLKRGVLHNFTIYAYGEMINGEVAFRVVNFTIYLKPPPPIPIVETSVISISVIGGIGILGKMGKLELITSKLPFKKK